VQSEYTKASGYKRALEISWLAVIFLVPLFFNPLSHQAFYLNKALLLQFLVMAMLAFWVADWIHSGASHQGLKWKSILTSPLHLSILAFGMLTIVATAASITPAISFWGSYFRKSGLLTLICWILFFLIMAQQVRSRQQLFRAIYALLLSSAIVSIVGILQHFLPDILFGYGGFRVSSTTGNANSLRIFLAMAIPLNMALIINSWNKWIHPHPLPSREREVSREGKNAGVLVGLIILLVLQFWCLWLAQPSATILLYIITPIIFLMLLGIIKRKKLLLSFVAISVLVVGIVAGLVLTPLQSTETGVGTLKSGDTGYRTSDESQERHSVGARLQFWRCAIDVVIQPPEVPFSNDRLHPLRTFIGYGPETFIITYQRFLPEDSHSLLFIPLTRPHNHYLYLAATVGLLGLASFLSILAVFFFLCFRYLRKSTSDTYKLLLIALAASMVGYMADSLFNPSTMSAELVFWLILSLVPAIGRLTSGAEPAKAALEEAARHSSNETPHISKTRPYLAMGCAILLIVIGIGITIRPFLADMYLQKGLNLQAARSDQAVFAFDKAAKIDPGEAVYWNCLGRYSYPVAQLTAEKPLKAEVLAFSTDAYEKAQELEPYIAYRYYSLADVYTYWAQEGDAAKWPTALSLYDKASQLSPRDVRILNKWSLALIVKGDLDKARAKLDCAASIDPDWLGNALISGLLLTREGNDDEAAQEIMAPIQANPDEFGYFGSLCFDLSAYGMVHPMAKALEVRTEKVPDEWIPHAMLGVTSLFVATPDKSLNEFNTAMSLVPVEDVGNVFGAIVGFSKRSPYLKAQLPSIAPEWRGKLSQAEHSDALLRELDKLLDNPSQG